MKYLVVIGDGMADNPVEALGGKTPLEYADIPPLIPSPRAARSAAL